MSEEPCRKPEGLAVMGKAVKVLSSLDVKDPERGALFAEVSRAAERVQNCPCRECCQKRAIKRLRNAGRP